ncbi:unnamed protein product [Amoebophrya sp. A25]|nr:unnamed protein product [Amoebophrya sp. A25]|eukprot:GSA25T00012933001.1
MRKLSREARLWEEAAKNPLPKQGTATGAKATEVYVYNYMQLATCSSEDGKLIDVHKNTHVSSGGGFFDLDCHPLGEGGGHKPDNIAHRKPSMSPAGVYNWYAERHDFLAEKWKTAIGDRFEPVENYLSEAYSKFWDGLHHLRKLTNAEVYGRGKKGETAKETALGGPGTAEYNLAKARAREFSLASLVILREKLGLGAAMPKRDDLLSDSEGFPV